MVVNSIDGNIVGWMMMDCLVWYIPGFLQRTTSFILILQCTYKEQSREIFKDLAMFFVIFPWSNMSLVYLMNI